METEGKYILNNEGEVQEEKDLFKWAKFMSSGKQRLAYTSFPKYYVSTIFLGLDYGFGTDKPILFETMVFEKEVTKPDEYTDPETGILIPQQNFQKSVDLGDYQNRYFTKEEALAGHEVICKYVKNLK